MSDISLDDGKILVEGEWLSADELKDRIKEKMDAGDMHFAGLAQALETLNQALENSHPLEIRTVITKTEYERLRALGGGDDRTCVKAAIAAFIGPTAGAKKMTVIRCANCKARIEIPTEDRPTEVRCPKCNAVGRLKSKT
jgi:hypothetical protein